MEETEKKAPRSRKRQPLSNRKKAIIASAAIAVGVAGASGAVYYIHEGQQYQTVFFPNTVVNGIDVSRKTVDEVKTQVAALAGDYTLTITGREGVTEQIAGSEIGFRHEFDGSLEQYLAAQDPMDWWSHRDQTTEYQISTMFAVDDALLADRIEKLVFLQDDQMVEPENAYLSDYIEGQGYMVVPETGGTVVDKDAVRSAVTDAVHAFQSELSLEDMDVYKKAEITSDDAELNAQADELNHYVGLTVTYQFGDDQEILNGDIIDHWISRDEEGNLLRDEEGGLIIDQEQVTEYVKSLAEKYDTAGKAKTLRTTYGPTVTIEGGTYGWRIDQKEEAKQLYEIVLSGESQTREPVYSQSAASHGETDFGETYVEINLTAQHLYFYKDGQLVVHTDLVSGSHARGDDTPAGAYPVAYKQRNAVLRGRRADGSYAYQSPVSYWMPFNGGIGLHDATWRGAFGGNIYLTNGSHGCVNLPKKAAETIFENISKGDPVLCYHLEGTSGAAPENPTETAAAETRPAETSAARETTAARATTAAPETQPAIQPEPETQPAPETSPVSPEGTEESQPAGPGGQTPAGPGSSAGPGGGPGGQTPAGPGSSAGPGGGPGGQTPAGPGGGPGAASDQGLEPGPDAEAQAPAGPGGGTPVGPGYPDTSGNEAGPGGSEGPGQSGPGSSGPGGPG